MSDNCGHFEWAIIGEIASTAYDCRFLPVLDGQKNTEDKSLIKILLFGSVFRHVKSFVLSFGEIPSSGLVCKCQKQIW